ncbi:hypothetical protein ABGB19_17545 [Mycobacterium sp. B14F4]|uniref:hypothetical protein n=1 Tax=Mycobacterium sp. B14F4 TaxID=3153565 RepID=UPI00325C648D
MRFLVVGFSLALTGCGLFSGDADSVPRFASSSAIQRALGAAGITCHTYQSVPKEDRESGMGAAADVGECEIDDETPKLVIWSDKRQQDDWADTSKQIGCTMGEGYGVSTLDYVAGDRWSISDTSEKLATKLADAVGGQAVHVECEGG